MIPVCDKCGRDSIQHRNPRIRHAFVHKDDTPRELKAHVDLAVAALEAKDLNRADFHIRNAQSCLNVLKNKVEQEEDSSWRHV